MSQPLRTQPRWIWTRIEELLRGAEWTGEELNACSQDVYGRSFTELTRVEGLEILRSLAHLVGFKRWKRHRIEVSRTQGTAGNPEAA